MNQRATKRKEKTTYDLQNEKQEEISILMRFRLIYIYIYIPVAVTQLLTDFLECNNR
jgi:hypothetical protein